MPLAMRYAVTADITVTVRAEDGTTESYTVQGTARSASYASTLQPVIGAAIQDAQVKSASHAKVVEHNEKERLK